jgi:hypothetical protein
LVSFILGWFLSFSLSFMTWSLWSLLASYFLECCSIWVCMLFPHNCIQVMHFGKNIIEVALCFSVCPVRKIRFDHLAARIHQCQTTVLSFEMIKHLTMLRNYVNGLLFHYTFAY